MPLSVLGVLHHNDATEYRNPAAPFDVDYLRRAAKMYDDCGFDRVLIGQHARSPDPLCIAAFVTPHTQRLKFMIAHRPGFIAPTMAARMFATLDRLSRGRCAVHIITAGSDVETRGDGDFLTKEQRYMRSREYVAVLGKIWMSGAPVDHDGDFYSFRQGFSDVRPASVASIPIFWGGASALGVTLGAECADVYALGGCTVEEAARLVAAVDAAAARCGRKPDYCMSMRVIMAPTEAEAWERADSIRSQIAVFRAAGGSVGRDQGEAGRRAVEEAVQRDAASRAGHPEPRPAGHADRHLWDGLTVAVQGRTHITTLVGTPDQLTAALMPYYDLGISQFILTGFEPIEDSVAIGRELIPRLQRVAAARRIAAA